MSVDPPREAPSPDPHSQDRMQPPGVATRPLLLWIVGVFVMSFVAAALLWGAYRARVASTPVAVARPFPAPQLETNQTPRETSSTSHGPGPYRAVPTDVRVGERHSPSDPMQAAMLAEAARGPAAYDPVANGGTP